MGFERVALFGIIDLELDATTGGTLTLSTDLPGNLLVVRETKTILPTGRRVARFRLKGSTKGRLYSVKLVPAGYGVIRLYGGRIWARVLPGAEWSWYPLPIPETGQWEPRKLEIPETGPWQPVKIGIPETSEWQPVKIGIPETSEWQPVKLPIRETPENPSWVDVEIDQ